MKISRYGRSVAIVWMLALLAGCGGAPPAPTQPGTSALAGAAAQAAGHGRSWIKPGAASGDLLYIGGSSESWIFSYPDGEYVGGIAAGSSGTCSDNSGNVYLTRTSNVTEYAHGGTSPIASFSVPGTATACSFDPTTGNLAVVVSCFASCGQEVAVFSGPTKPPVTFEDPGLSILYCGYDNAGNLFVDGEAAGKFGFAELPSGGSTLANVAIDLSVTNPGQVQWDGQYVTVEERFHPAVYQISVSGSTATVVNTVKFNEIGLKAGQSWIDGGTIVIPYAPGRKRPKNVRFWNYPAGGNATKTLRDFILRHMSVNGVTVSSLPSQHKESR
ncbi:MAG: hypothetical protein WA814_04825 [Candidatus Baltobacteraceae bacterium]